jgi:hypothetical protein
MKVGHFWDGRDSETDFKVSQQPRKLFLLYSIVMQSNPQMEKTFLQSIFPPEIFACILLIAALVPS